jgi:di/tricarboxylate transporter
MSVSIALTVIAVATPLVLMSVTRLPPALVLCAAMLFLALSGVISIGEAVAGFGSAAVLTIALLYVVVAGLKETGAIAWIARLLMRRPGTLTTTNGRLLTTATALSTVVNNTPVVAMFIPIAQDWAKRARLPISQMLLPLNNAVILGGLCTLIGTSTNITVNGLYSQANGHGGLDFFELAWVGVPLALLGVAYALIAAPRLLRANGAVVLGDLTRDAAHRAPSLTSTTLCPESLLTRSAEPLAAVAAAVDSGMYSSSLAVSADNLPRVRAGASRVRAPVALAILCLIVANGVLEFIPLLAAVAIAAVLMVAARCVSWRAAITSVDYASVIGIAASFSLGAALTQSGAAAELGAWVGRWSGSDAFVALAMLYIATVILTEVITNNAAGVVMFPVALSIAAGLGADPKPFVIVVMVGASAGFLTPIGYQTNLMVYGPGGYRLLDYVRYGLPLSILTGVVTLAIVPRIWPL